MQIGMIGLGRMGANMVQRLMNDGHECVVFDINAGAVADLAAQGAVGAHSLEDFIAQLSKPRPIWLMLPAAIVDQELTALAPLLEAGDIVIDGGNSFYRASGLERLFRDIQGARFHRPQERTQLRFSGRFALGLGIDE